MKPAESAAARMWQLVERLGFADNDQSVIAKTFGVSQGVVSQWKAGKGGLDAARALAYQEQFGVRAAWLLVADGPPMLADLGTDLYQMGIEAGRVAGITQAITALEGLRGDTTDRMPTDDAEVVRLAMAPGQVKQPKKAPAQSHKRNR